MALLRSARCDTAAREAVEAAVHAEIACRFHGRHVLRSKFGSHRKITTFRVEYHQE